MGFIGRVRLDTVDYGKGPRVERNDAARGIGHEKTVSRSRDPVRAGRGSASREARKAPGQLFNQGI